MRSAPPSVSQTRNLSPACFVVSNPDGQREPGFEARPLLCFYLINASIGKEYSASFACTGFSEVRIQQYDYFRCSTCLNGTFDGT